jgi:hypothetical protein
MVVAVDQEGRTNMARAMAGHHRIPTMEDNIANMMEELYSHAHSVNQLEAEMSRAVLKHAAEEHRLQDILHAGYTHTTGEYPVQQRQTSKVVLHALSRKNNHGIALEVLNDLEKNLPKFLSACPVAHGGRRAL